MKDNSKDLTNDSPMKEENYPSAKILLDLAYKEYMYETERKKTLETKSGICIALCGTMLTILIVRLGGANIPIWCSKWAFWESAIIFFQFSFFIGTFATLVLAIYEFIDVLLIAVYQRLDIESSMEYTSNEEGEFSQFLIGYINDYVAFNSGKNLEKSNSFSSGLKYIKRSIKFMVLFMFFRVLAAFLGI